MFDEGLSEDVEAVSLGASVVDGGITEGLKAVALEAKRAREFGFGAGEFDRAKKWVAAYYERAYNERDKTESSSFAGEYVRHFLEGEPAPGIEYEYKLVQQLLPGITAEEITALGKILLADDSRVVLATSPQKPGIKVPTEEELKTALATVESTPVTPWKDTTRPHVTAIRLMRGGRELPADLVRGAVDVIAEAHDVPPVAVPPPWNGLPVTPARLRWRVLHNDRVVRRWHTPVDFTRTMIPKERFRSVYAPGTRQNRAGSAGLYRFYLAHTWSTDLLPDGRYRIEVEASDLSGNVGTLAATFTIVNGL
jgi:hypothetical protein